MKGIKIFLPEKLCKYSGLKTIIVIRIYYIRGCEPVEVWQTSPKNLYCETFQQFLLPGRTKMWNPYFVFIFMLFMIFYKSFTFVSFVWHGHKLTKYFAIFLTFFVCCTRRETRTSLFFAYECCTTVFDLDT